MPPFLGFAHITCRVPVCERKGNLENPRAILPGNSLSQTCGLCGFFLYNHWDSYREIIFEENSQTFWLLKHTSLIDEWNT
jgi:hypothetical protein